MSPRTAERALQQRRKVLRECLQLALELTKDDARHMATQNKSPYRVAHAWLALHRIAGMAELEVEEFWKLAGWRPFP